MRAALKAHPMPMDGQEPLVLTLSIGWLSLPPGAAAPKAERLMRALDEAMYAVKLSGKDGEREAVLDTVPVHGVGDAAPATGTAAPLLPARQTTAG